ncbi:MAG: hypothetical protein RL179_1511 [Planctomycetota bacterium]|jgi:hypothetical protein
MYLKYVSLSLISLVCLVISASGQDKNNKKKSLETFSKSNISKLQTNHFVGRVSSNPTNKNITVQIPVQKVVQKNDDKDKDNNKNDNNNKNGKNDNNKNGKNKSPNSQAQNMQKQIAQAQAKQIQLLKSLQVATEWVEVDIPIKDATKIRSKTLLEAYDDKGSIKKYTAEELKALKGSNPNLPGYEVKIDELAPGSVVEVTLGKSSGGNNNKKDDDDLFATMVMVIGKDSSFKAPADNSKNKKK